MNPTEKEAPWYELARREAEEGKRYQRQAKKGMACDEPWLPQWKEKRLDEAWAPYHYSYREKPVEPIRIWCQIQGDYVNYVSVKEAVESSTQFIQLTPQIASMLIREGII